MIGTRLLGRGLSFMGRCVFVSFFSVFAFSFGFFVCERGFFLFLGLLVRIVEKIKESVLLVVKCNVTGLNTVVFMTII